MNVAQPITSMHSAQALLKQGFALLNQGRFKEAARLCQQLISQNPQIPQAHFLVGLVALSLRDRVTAVQAFGSVTKLQPDHAAAWAQMAKLFIEEGQVNRADQALKEAEKYGSSDPLVQDLLGTVYSRLGDHERAKVQFEQAVEASPEQPQYLLNLANNRVYHGELTHAENIYKSVLIRTPNHAQAHWALATARKTTDSEHIEAMQKLLLQPNISSRSKAFLHYAIGKECEDINDWDTAIDSFKSGAKARRVTVEYDESAEQEMFDFLAENCSQRWLAEGEGSDHAAPIFVLGQPRTGTTLIERIITSHSDVTSAGELQQFGMSLRRLNNHQDPRRFSAGLFAASMALDYKKVGNSYMEATQRLHGSTSRFVDKLPVNYLLIPFILKAFPKAKIVHLTRNPMDACFASYKQLFADAYLHSYDQREMARHHARYLRLMKVYRERFSGRFFDISYEATARDIEPNARALIDYLDLPWQDDCLNFHQQTAAVSTASAVQVREPAHTRSIGRWRRYEEQLQPMRDELIAQGVVIE